MRLNIEKSECEDAKGQLYGIGMFGKNYAMLGMTKTCLADLETYPKQIGPQEGKSTGPNENKGQNTSTTRVSFITVMSFSRFSHGI